LNSNINVGSHAVVNNGATLYINDNINITGNFSQSSGQLVFGVSSLNSHGSLSVSGTTNLAGGVVGLKSTDGVLQAGNYTIVSSGGAMSLGNISFVATGYKVTGQTVASGGETDLVLSVAGLTTNYAPIGFIQGGPAFATAKLIDRISTITSEKSTTTPEAAAVNVEVMAPLAELSVDRQRVALSQLSPNQLTPQMMAMVAVPVSDAIARHQQVVSSALVSQKTTKRPVMLWGEFIGGAGQRDATRKAAGFNWFTSGVVAGGDIAIGTQAAIGMAVSWTSNTANGTDIFAGSRSKIDSHQFTAYGSWRPAWRKAGCLSTPNLAGRIT
jgi:outer membrane autotransporter protein